MSEAELHWLRQRLHQGRLNKARRGELAVAVPIGYVRRPSGEVALDPDEQVQHVVRLVFRAFERLGTLNGLLQHLVRHGVRLGVRVRGGSGWGPLLIGAIAIGLLGAGLFVTDPLNGYPPGTPDLPVERSPAGVLHDLCSTPVFLGFPAACIVLGRRFLAWGESGWAWYSIATGIAFFGAFVLTSIDFGRLAGGALADV